MRLAPLVLILLYGDTNSSKGSTIEKPATPGSDVLSNPLFTCNHTLGSGALLDSRFCRDRAHSLYPDLQ